MRPLPENGTANIDGITVKEVKVGDEKLVNLPVFAI